MEKWFVAAKKADFKSWAEEFNISPVMARIIRNRGMEDKEEVRKFLYGTLDDTYDPFLLKDMEKTVNLILDALKKKKKMRVIGDYDVDGICSSYILTKGLQILGADVDTVIPHRILDGYGLNDSLIREASNDAVELILTCDNGISACKQIELANEMGIDVIVTDHHEVPYEQAGESKIEILPPALAIVDPKQEGCPYPFKNICGGVVVYKLMEALCHRTANRRLSDACGEFIEFAAMATVCDVMPLLDENRIIVKEGLKRMKNSSNAGIRALIEINEIDRDKLNAFHLGFVIGPCLNATGRLDTARRALEMLNSKTLVEAMSSARELKELNDSRKNLTQKGVLQAEDYIASNNLEADKVLVVYLPDVHESLAGIIAGRIREKYNKPVFVLTKGEEGVKGSGRSIDEYNMYDSMTELKQYFTKYGGHKLAAGLSMREEDIEPLRAALNRNCKLTNEDFCVKVHIDVPMPLDYADMELANQMELLEPFGMGNSKPLFAQKDVRLKALNIYGKNQNVAKLGVVTESGANIQLTMFGSMDMFRQFLEDKYGPDAFDIVRQGKGDYLISVVYQLGINSYKGKIEIQFVLQNYR